MMPSILVKDKTINLRQVSLVASDHICLHPLILFYIQRTEVVSLNPAKTKFIT